MNATKRMISAILAALAALCLLAGCAAYPNVQCDHWIHSGSYGVVTTKYEATAVQKTADGGFHVGTYSGSVSVLGGYGVSDVIQGLTLGPDGKPASAPVPAVAK